MQKKCIGCGIPIQTEDKSKEGFVPQNVLEEKDDIICMRCFKIKNYGQDIPVSVSEEDYKRELEGIIKKVDVFLWILDIIDFEGSFDENVLRIIKKKPIIVVVNKIDLIPNRKHPSEVANWVKCRLAEIDVDPIDIAILSVKREYGVNGIIKKLKHFYKKGGTVAVAGVTNVGKSSLINKLLQEDKYITVSKYPGTTLNVIHNKIPNTNFDVIDTPGIIPEGRFSDLVCNECSTSMVPSKEISRMTFKMKPNRVLLLGGLVQIKILDNESSNPIFTVYASKAVKFHETNTEKSADLIKSHTGDLLTPPCDICKEDYFRLEKQTKNFKVNQDEELVFKGLGWITVKRGPLLAEITYPEKAEITVRKAFIEPRRESNED